MRAMIVYVFSFYRYCYSTERLKAMSGKKLINTVDRCVDENLEGLVAVNPGLRLIKNTRVVVRADIEEVKRQGKVTLLCGGGSGHEPAHAGILFFSFNLNMQHSRSFWLV